jgi:hypothetical protein
VDDKNGKGIECYSERDNEKVKRGWKNKKSIKKEVFAEKLQLPLKPTKNEKAI